MSEEPSKRLLQARDAKRRRVALIAAMKADGYRVCKHRLCIGIATEDGYCQHHMAEPPARRTGGPCITCGAPYAMPGAKLCGACSEAAEERRLATRRENKRKRNARINGEAA